MTRSKASIQATARWEAENYDRLLTRFPRGTLDRIRATGESLNGFTVRAVLELLEAMEAVQRSQDIDAPGD